MKSEYPSLKLEENGLAAGRAGDLARLRLREPGSADAGFPSVTEMMSPFEAEVSQYRFEDMQPMGAIRHRPRDVNWKNVGDNYSDNLHIPVSARWPLAAGRQELPD
jgi:hypothetical protein